MSAPVCWWRPCTSFERPHSVCFDYLLRIGCQSRCAFLCLPPRLYLTDGPGPYQQVNVDIQEVRVKTSDDTTQWLALPTHAGVYNLLDFQHGVKREIHPQTGNQSKKLGHFRPIRFTFNPGSDALRNRGFPFLMTVVI